MYSTLWKTTGGVLMLALVLAAGAIAQPHQQQQPDHTRALREQPASADEEEDDEADEAPMMQRMRGMMQQMQEMMQQMHHMISGGMPSRGMPGDGMMWRHLERLAQQLGLTDEQRVQAKALLRTHAKEIIRLRANVATLRIDLRELLDTDPVDLAKVKPLVQTIAAQEAELRLSHLTAMQEVRKLLTPEQQKRFRAMQDSMMEGGERRGHGGMPGHEGMPGGGLLRRGGILGHGRMLGRGLRAQ